MIKIITGLRRSGKSYLLFELFRAHLIENGVSEEQIIAFSLENRRMKKLRNPDECIAYIDAHIKGDKMHYVMIDEVQMMAEFEDVLNSYLDMPNVDVYVTGSNSRFLVSDVVTEFRGRGDEVRVLPLSISELHAAYPENGRNPSETLARLILEVENITREFQRQGKIVRMTVIGVEIGSNSYGMSASEGEVRFTVRAEKEAEFESYLKEIRKMAEGMARKGGFTLEMEEIERFPATENHAKEVEKVRGVAQKLGLQTMELPEPMRWSEDFGYYLRECRGAFFGMGDGEEYPQLHTAEYEFPDEILTIAVELLFAIAMQ